jgi:hypothetical protein
VARLDAAAATPEVPVPTDVQQRWQDALERAAQNDGRSEARAPARRFFADWRWQAAAAAVAVVAIAGVMQLATRAKPELTVENVPTAVPAAGADASAYERGLKVHLANTERQIAELDDADPEQRARLIETIIAQNRIYALAAERAGEPQLARVLRAFAPVLEGLEKGDAAASVAQLTFELRVMQGRLSAETGDPSGTSSTTL